MTAKEGLSREDVDEKNPTSLEEQGDDMRSTEGGLSIMSDFVAHIMIYKIGILRKMIP